MSNVESDERKMGNKSFWQIGMGICCKGSHGQGKAKERGVWEEISYMDFMVLLGNSI